MDNPKLFPCRSNDDFLGTLRKQGRFFLTPRLECRTLFRKISPLCMSFDILLRRAWRQLLSVETCMPYSTRWRFPGRGLSYRGRKAGRRYASPTAATATMEMVMHST